MILTQGSKYEYINRDYINLDNFTLEACLLGHLWNTAAAIGSSVPGGPVLTTLQILFTSSEQLKKKKQTKKFQVCLHFHEDFK